MNSTTSKKYERPPSLKAFIFSGQGSQRVGMAKDLTEHASQAKEYLQMADDILGYSLSELMTTGTMPELKQTKVTQPAVYAYSVIKARIMRGFEPDMVAGHSLGEFSALAAVRAFTYADGMRLVNIRAQAMQEACEKYPSSMAAVLGLENEIIEATLAKITDEVVVPANYNCPGQVVISGSLAGLALAETALMDAGARRVLPLKVSGAFHSPLMEEAREKLAEAVDKINFLEPEVPVYQNVNGLPSTNPNDIKKNIVDQLTSPVRWVQTVENMVEDGATTFTEIGPKNVVSNLVKRISSKAIIIEN